MKIDGKCRIDRRQKLIFDIDDLLPEDLESHGTPWESLLASGFWEMFWESKEVRLLIDTTERLLKRGRGLTLDQIARLQSRLETIEDLRALPLAGVKRDRARREQESERAREEANNAASQRIIGLPRILP